MQSLAFLFELDDGEARLTNMLKGIDDSEIPCVLMDARIKISLGLKPVRTMLCYSISYISYIIDITFNQQNVNIKYLMYVYKTL